MNKKYDYLIVGSGFFGSIFAHELHKRGKKVLVLEKRSHIGGNVYSERVHGIDIHKYGPHIFHTNNKEVWDYINSFVTMEQFVYSPVGNYNGELYNLPFNMNTFYQMWKVKTPEEAIAKIEEQKNEYKDIEPTNLEEQAYKLVGKDIYEKLIKGYTEKQWGRKATELPPFIIKRLPVRLTYDNNYFNDKYQGIPEDGYTRIFERMLEGIEVKLNTDFLKDKEKWEVIAEKIVYTGRIDEYYGSCFGNLEYRSLRFEEEILDKENYQGVAVVNYTDKETPFTRLIEHKHFRKIKTEKTIISREYPQDWYEGIEPYYPINDDKNNKKYEQYLAKSKENPNLIFGGRLGSYKYYNMDQVIEASLNAVKAEIG